MSIVSTAAMLAVFSNFASGEILKGFDTAMVIIASALTMIAVSLIASRKEKFQWLNEWSLGLSIIVSLTVGYFIL
jgi:hypothetical protein